jgi:glycosyltransferase involved in cell wall biosynthesis
VTTAAPAISVLIVTHNAAPHIADTVRSVLAQTFSDWELIVVDDGSRDATLEILGGFDDPRIVVLPQAHHGDWGHWRNVAAQDYATGTYIAPLDHDDIWLPDKLARQHAALEATGAVMSYTGWALLHEDGRTSVVPRLALNSDEQSDRLAMLNRTAGTLHSSFVMQRQAFLDAGGYQGDPRISEAPLIHRLRGVGRFAEVNAPLTLWRLHGAQTSRDEEGMARVIADTFLRAMATDPAEDPVIREAAARLADLTLARLLVGDRGRPGFRARVRSNPRALDDWAWLLASYVPRAIMVRVRAAYQRRPRRSVRTGKRAHA